MSDEGQLFVAKESANFDLNGQPIFISQGTIVRAGHPMLTGREHLFEPLKVDYDHDAKATEKAEKKDDKSLTPESKTEARASEGAVASSRAEHQGSRVR